MKKPEPHPNPKVEWAMSVLFKDDFWKLVYAQSFREVTDDMTELQAKIYAARIRYAEKILDEAIRMAQTGKTS